MIGYTKLILIIDFNLKIVLLKDFTILQAEEYILENNDIIDGIIFNFTKIEKLINHFIIKHNLQQTPTIILLKDNLIIHTLNQNLELDTKKYLLTTFELQFYPNLVIYNLGIKHYQIFQYSLLCSNLNIQLISISTSILDLNRLFKIYTHRTIDSRITTIGSLKNFLKSTIYDSKSSICNLTTNIDTFLSIY